jgi:hypothetical protein
MNSSTLPAIDPNRGTILAAGGVLLAAAVGVITFRLDDSWGAGIHLLVALVAFVVVYGAALRSPVGDAPLAYQSALALAGLALLAIVLLRLADVFLGDDEPGSGTLIWVSLIFVAVAIYSADRFRSKACALLAMLGVAVFVLAFVDKVFGPDDPAKTFRWIVLLLALAFAGAAVALRDGAREGWDVQAVNAAGLMLIVLASLLLGGSLSPAGALGAVGGVGGIDIGFGWELVLVVGSLAVIGYAVITRERGPGYIGFVALVFAIVIIAAGKATLIGWPIVLLLAGIGAFALGLAPGAGGGRGADRPRRDRPAAAPPTGPTREAPPTAGGPPPA